jgi:hypothetical protein
VGAVQCEPFSLRVDDTLLHRHTRVYHYEYKSVSSGENSTHIRTSMTNTLGELVCNLSIAMLDLVEEIVTEAESAH